MNPTDPFERPLPLLAGATLCLFLGLLAATDRNPAPPACVEMPAQPQPAGEPAP